METAKVVNALCLGHTFRMLPIVWDADFLPALPEPDTKVSFRNSYESSADRISLANR
jgi:hypothetical protein